MSDIDKVTMVQWVMSVAYYAEELSYMLGRLVDNGEAKRIGTVQTGLHNLVRDISDMLAEPCEEEA